ncbi:uncharacterized protein ASPGLDRAFT_47263 [Aspergillus glaucus CBS 516.65]|uniref:Amino acid transporter transmembrane domain-containing protein n=1 Tax=Aspergillus glaucus CBS 516.65 TaxID=1160497 RepID=A0A1L9VKG8_ASPGL|nr:hypothetical protein ASPGLDRAFT_47263 [Aspergillus glaucus CBS 516.65]OJJ84382.1 hypothetical protein ASPGLDRAFT_47263 [Aspergillus glaucus CBS 516.65]
MAQDIKVENGPEPQYYDQEDVKSSPPSAQIDPFGAEDSAEIKYKTLTWWQTGIIMIAETVSLGVLSLPAAVASIGMAPAVVLIFGLGVISTYSGYLIGQFRQKYPFIHSMADAGDILMGPVGRNVLEMGQLLFFLFATGSHLLTFTVMMNTLTEHGTCSIVFGVVGLILSFLFSLPRTMKNVSWLAMASFVSIFVAVVITMIGVGVERPGKGIYSVTQKTDFVSGFTAVTNIVFAYCGHPGYFGFIAEMKNPEDFPKSLCMQQGFEIVLYTISAAVIYRYTGDSVASPALGSTGPLLRKIAYGIAIPTIVIAGVVLGHVAIKNVYVRIFRGTNVMHQKSLLGTGAWIGLTLVFWTISWVIAEAIPVFSDLLSLISALFVSWFSYGLPGIFWLYMYWGDYFSSPKKILLFLANVGLVGIGTTICACGLWVSGLAIHEDSKGAAGSFSCANNA